MEQSFVKETQTNPNLVWGGILFENFRGLRHTKFRVRRKKIGQNGLAIKVGENGGISLLLSDSTGLTLFMAALCSHMISLSEKVQLGVSMCVREKLLDLNLGTRITHAFL